MTTQKKTKKTINRSGINRRLKGGICEVKYLDDDGNTQTVSVTLKKWHINPDNVGDWIDHDYKVGYVVAWDMIKIGWIQIPINKVTFFEQLTGVPRT
jgi:hypothetical protein